MDEVEHGQDLTNQEAFKLYPVTREPGVGPIRVLEIKSHAQYRMDLRGITVDDVRHTLNSFLQQMGQWKAVRSPAYERMGTMLENGEHMEWVDPKTRLKIVFVAEGGGKVTLITTFRKGEDGHPGPVDCHEKQGMAQRVAARYYYAQQYAFLRKAMNHEDAKRILGLYGNPSEAEITRAYRQMALKNHPDRGGNHADMVALNAAKAVLLTPEPSGFGPFTPEVQEDEYEFDSKDIPVVPFHSGHLVVRASAKVNGKVVHGKISVFLVPRELREIDNLLDREHGLALTQVKLSGHFNLGYVYAPPGVRSFTVKGDVELYIEHDGEEIRVSTLNIRGLMHPLIRAEGKFEF